VSGFPTQFHRQSACQKIWCLVLARAAHRSSHERQILWCSCLSRRRHVLKTRGNSTLADAGTISFRDRVRQAIAAYQLVGGVVGVVAILETLPSVIANIDTSERTAVLVRYCPPMIGLACLVLAGVLLLRDSKAGILLTVLAQISQMWSMSSESGTYWFLVGVYWIVGMQGRSVRSTGGLGVDWRWEVSNSIEWWGINLFPVVMLFLLWFSCSTPRDRSSNAARNGATTDGDEGSKPATTERST
jgi:hypothetical protein